MIILFQEITSFSTFLIIKEKISTAESLFFNDSSQLNKQVGNV